MVEPFATKKDAMENITTTESPPSMTGREREVCALLCAHMSSKEIGAVLGISPKTVDKRIDAARLKLGCADRNALARAVVIHPANYVSDSGHHAGRSWGCPAVDPDVHDEVINKLRGGAMIFAYGGKAKTF